MCGGDAPEAPDPINPAIPIAIESLFASRGQRNPYGRTYLSSGGNEMSQEQISRILAAALSGDPNQPNLAALAPLLAAEVVTEESPEVRGLREQDQAQNFWRRQLADPYLRQFGMPFRNLPGAEGTEGGGPGGYMMADGERPSGVPELAQLGAGRRQFGFPELPALVPLNPDLFRGYFSRRRPNEWRYG
jgi:hypothetical protein